MRIAKWLGGALWAGSWYLMYLEITRWHHVKPTLMFNAEAIPGTDIRPKPGAPLKLLYIACAASPCLVAIEIVREIRAQRPQQRAPHHEMRPQLPSARFWKL